MARRPTFIKDDTNFFKRLEESKRRSVEEALQKAHDESKNKVRGRTVELTQSNTQLKKDITESKQAEEESTKLLSVIHQVYDIVFITDLNGIIEYVNPAFERITGYSREDAVGKSTRILKSGEMSLEHYKQLWDTILSGKTLRADVINKKKNGEIWIYDQTITPLRDSQGKLINFISTGKDITERKRAEDELKKSHSQLRHLSARLQTIREEERTQIAREIHDELGQALTALEMDISWLNKKLPDDQKQLIEKTRSMLLLTDTTIQSVQKISAELRPVVLDDLGLTAAIKWQANEFENRSGIKCEVTINPEDIVLEKDCSTAIFRIFQETLTNVARHAEATKVKVSLEVKDDLLILNVMDNGKGITEEQISSTKSLGLLGMRERLYPWNGEIEIKGQKEKGTTVTVCFPLCSRK